MGRHTVFAIHTFMIKYRAYRDKDAAVMGAEIEAESKAKARVMWRHDPRAEGNALVSIELKR